MLPASFILVVLFSFLFPSDSYHAVVVDATTGRPLPDVEVTDLTTQDHGRTDAYGHFTLPGGTVHFQLRHLGFAPLAATRPSLPPGYRDTLRLLPEAVALGEVRVRPIAPVTWSSLGSKISDKQGVLVVPGTQYGVWFHPAPDAAPAVVEQILLRLRPNNSTAGQIRIRLVAAVDGQDQPSFRDLLPVAATYTAAQLRTLPAGLLTVDISTYGLKMPPQGFFVLVEGLATGYPAEVPVPMHRDDPTPGLILTATDLHNPATYRRTPMNNFPALVRASSITEVESVVRQCCNGPWHRRQREGKLGKVNNIDVSLTLRAE